MPKPPCPCDDRPNLWCNEAGCELARPGAAEDPNRCHICWLYHHNPYGHRELWGGKGGGGSLCKHLGDETRRVGCPTCKGKVELKVFACEIHGECTRAKPGPGVKACCHGCNEYEPRPRWESGLVRNLIYHIAPASGNGVWQRNVAQLLKRIDLFNGRRVVAIVTGQARRLDYRAEFELDPPDRVKEALAGHVHEFIELPNDPKLREVVTFLPLLERVATTNPAEITFYGHAKGVTRPVNDGVTVHRWADLMYETCLDYPALVEDHLSRLPITGTFKKVVHGFAGSASAWHYSGAFFWLRNSAVFSRPDWRRVDRQWWGNEAWPGLHFTPDEAGCLFHQGGQEMDLFRMGYLRGTVEPAYELWKHQRVLEQPVEVRRANAIEAVERAIRQEEA